MDKALNAAAFIAGGIILTVSFTLIFWGLCVIVGGKLERWQMKAKRRRNFISDAKLRAMNITPLLPKDWK